MSAKGDLFRAILDAPSDVALRLAYADCLEEDPGDPVDAARAELIRVDQQLDALLVARPGPKGSPSSKQRRAKALRKLARRKRALVAKYWTAERWAVEAPELVRYYGTRRVVPMLGAEHWRYGFPYRLMLPYPYFRESADMIGDLGGPTILRRVPICTTVKPSETEPLFPGTVGAEWAWVSAVYGWGHARLSPKLHAFLRPERRDGVWAYYATKEAALADCLRVHVRAWRQDLGMPDVDLSAIEPPASSTATRKKGP